jgi:hypothetical protein
MIIGRMILAVRAGQMGVGRHCTHGRDNEATLSEILFYFFSFYIFLHFAHIWCIPVIWGGLEWSIFMLHEVELCFIWSIITLHYWQWGLIVLHWRYGESLFSAQYGWVSPVQSSEDYSGQRPNSCGCAVWCVSEGYLSVVWWGVGDIFKELL